MLGAVALQITHICATETGLPSGYTTNYWVQFRDFYFFHRRLNSFPFPQVAQAADIRLAGFIE
jgi:hypothetical protein